MNITRAFGDANKNGIELDDVNLKRRLTKHYAAAAAAAASASHQPIIFREFTRESLETIQRRRRCSSVASKRKTNKLSTSSGAAAAVELATKALVKSEPDPCLASGQQLPPALIRHLPSELVGKPIEDIDPFYADQETFVIISRAKELTRFSAKNALYLFGPFHPIRRVVLYILVSSIFNLFVILTILTNCILMTIQGSEMVERTEIIFTIIYTTEMGLKVLARGFILDEFTYLRDPWNWLDFLVIIMAYLTIVVEDLGNLSVMRTFRVLRALKTVAIIPGMKTIVGAVIDSVKNLKDVVVLTLFSLSVFSLLGLQIYMGLLTQKCISNGPLNMTDLEWFEWNSNSSNWILDLDNELWGAYRLCGNASGAQSCPDGYTCLQGFGPNPDYGFTNFDTFGWALICSFRLMTQDFWEGLYMQVLKTAGSWHIIFFIVSIFLGSIYLMNLILAIVAMSYNELQRRAEEEEEAAAEDEAAFLESCRQMELRDGQLLSRNSMSCKRGYDTPDLRSCSGGVVDGTTTIVGTNTPTSYRPSVEIGLLGQTLLASLCQKGLLGERVRDRLDTQMMLPGAAASLRSHSLSVQRDGGEQLLLPQLQHNGMPNRYHHQHHYAYNDPLTMAASMTELRRKSSVRTNGSSSPTGKRIRGGGGALAPPSQTTGSLVGQRRLLPNISLSGQRLDRMSRSGSVRSSYAVLRRKSSAARKYSNLMMPMSASGKQYASSGVLPCVRRSTSGHNDDDDDLVTNQATNLKQKAARTRPSTASERDLRALQQRAAMIRIVSDDCCDPSQRAAKVGFAAGFLGALFKHLIVLCFKTGALKLTLNSNKSNDKHTPKQADTLAQQQQQQQQQASDSSGSIARFDSNQLLPFDPIDRLQVGGARQQPRQIMTRRKSDDPRHGQWALSPPPPPPSLSLVQEAGAHPRRNLSIDTCLHSVERNLAVCGQPSQAHPFGRVGAACEQRQRSRSRRCSSIVSAQLANQQRRLSTLSNVEPAARRPSLRLRPCASQQLADRRTSGSSLAALERSVGCSRQSSSALDSCATGATSIGSPSMGGRTLLEPDDASRIEQQQQQRHHQMHHLSVENFQQFSYARPAAVAPSLASNAGRARIRSLASELVPNDDQHTQHLQNRTIAPNQQQQLNRRKSNRPHYIHPSTMARCGRAGSPLGTPPRNNAEQVAAVGVRRLSRDFMRQANEWSRLSMSTNVDLRRLLRLWSHTNPYGQGARPSIGSCSTTLSVNNNGGGVQTKFDWATTSASASVSRRASSGANSSQGPLGTAAAATATLQGAYEVLAALSRRRDNRLLSSATCGALSITDNNNNNNYLYDNYNNPFITGDSTGYAASDGLVGGAHTQLSLDRMSISARDKCLAYCLSCLDLLCIWECCGAWLYVQRFLAWLVFDPFTELFIILCILINTLFMALDSDDADAQMRQIFERGNYFFTATFAVEATMKIVALSPKFYFRDGWNVFDSLIVGLSLLELGLEGVYGLSVLRSFRLLRVFKLAKSWPTLNLLISIMGKAVGDLGNLTFVLAIIVFIFAVMGMQLFGSKYVANQFPSGVLPRWNFTDFMHSFMIVFRILCAEWIEPMWDCLLVSGWPCIPFFLIAVTVGNLVVLNLFLALLLASFGASNLSSPQADNVDTKKLREAIGRFKRFGAWLRASLTRALNVLLCKRARQRRRRRRRQRRHKLVRLAHRCRRQATNISIEAGDSNASSDSELTMNSSEREQQHIANNNNKSHIVSLERIERQRNIERRTAELKSKIRRSPEHHYHLRQLARLQVHAGSSRPPVVASIPIIVNEASEENDDEDDDNGDADGGESELQQQINDTTTTTCCGESMDVSLDGANSIQVPYLHNMQTIREDDSSVSSSSSSSVSPPQQQQQQQQQLFNNTARRKSVSTSHLLHGKDDNDHHDDDVETSKVTHDDTSVRTLLLPAACSRALSQPERLNCLQPTTTNQDQHARDLDTHVVDNLNNQQQSDSVKPKSSLYLRAPKRQEMEEEDERALRNIETYIEKCICVGILCLKWFLFRQRIRRFVEHKYFDQCILVLIILSSGTLALEDKHLNERPMLKRTLDVLDTIFTIIFSLEMILKWLAFGLRRYFGNIWSWLDFIIVLVSFINLMASIFGPGKIQALKTMRTLRAMRGLRPLRALQRFQGMRVVVNALIQAIPSIFNVLLVCLIFWLIFSIMGVQMFGGKFWRCLEPETGDLVEYERAANKFECLERNLTWSNPQINFDNVLNAYLALFQVATFKGWIDIMNSATDSRMRDEQPAREANIYMYFYFVFFVIFGSFFTLNLFIGVIIDNFNEQKKKTGGSLEIFMTDDQKKYYHAMKKMRSKRPVRAMTRPSWPPQAFMFDITTSKRFDLIIMLIIGLNMFVMALEHYGQSSEFSATLERLNLLFIIIFTLECACKMFAMRFYFFFREPWNVFDFIVVLLSIMGVLMKEYVAKYFVSPTLLRVVRVVKVGRVLRLVKGAKGIRTLLFALAMSLPALFNICLLLFLVMFIYAIFGMSFFMHVRHRSGIDETFNFETFTSSIIVLFQMSTSAGWDLVLDPLMDEDNDCQRPDPSAGIEGTCGNKGIAIAYLISYVIVTFLIIINMYIAVILENYSQATEDVQEGLTDDDYEMYYEIWQKFDPNGTQYLPHSKLADFVDALEDPLRIAKPNELALVVLDINIYQGDQCYCVDILDALTKYFFTRKGLDIQVNEHLQKVQSTLHETPFERITTTYLLKREHYCAKVIQNCWRKWRERTRGAADKQPLDQLEATS